MILKILLKNKIFRSKLSKKVRNFFNIKPSFDLVDYTSKNISVSDAFIWRTDNGFKTIFKFTNIIKHFYGEEEQNLRIIFFDSNNNLIKEKYINGIETGELLIDQNFLNNIKGYGVFYVFHNSNSYLNGIIRNSCYTGYSLNDSLPSFVHGNTIAAEQNLNNLKINYGLGGISFYKKNIYTVQNYFNFDKTEIMLVNPTDKGINISINGKNVFLNRGYSRSFDTSKEKLIKIKSNCYLLRPIVFTYNNSFFDVYHG